MYIYQDVQNVNYWLHKHMFSLLNPVISLYPTPLGGNINFVITLAAMIYLLNKYGLYNILRFLKCIH